MQTVSDASGKRFLLVKRSRESWLVRDPDTGTERHMPAQRLTACPGESPLETAATAVPTSVHAELAKPGPRALGLLAEIQRRGPVSVRTMLTDYDLCESDLHGLLAEFRAAGLIEEVRSAGERGYAPADSLLDSWS